MLAGTAVTSGSAAEDATSAAPPAPVTKPPETVAKQRRMRIRLDQPRRRGFELRRHITVPMTARAAAAAATFGRSAASHEKALAKKPTLTLPLRTGAVSRPTSEPEACPATNPDSPRMAAEAWRRAAKMSMAFAL